MMITLAAGSIVRNCLQKIDLEICREKKAFEHTLPPINITVLDNQFSIISKDACPTNKACI